MTLNGREIEILTLVAKGMNLEECSAWLGLSERFLKAALDVAMNKLGVTNLDEAVTAARNLGYLRPDENDPEYDLG